MTMVTERLALPDVLQSLWIHDIPLETFRRLFLVILFGGSPWAAPPPKDLQIRV